MRYPASEKAEIIRLVEQSTCRPSARWTSAASREPRFIAGWSPSGPVRQIKWFCGGAHDASRTVHYRLLLFGCPSQRTGGQPILVSIKSRRSIFT